MERAMKKRDAKELARRYRIDDPKRFRLRDVDPGDTAGLALKAQAKDLLARGVERLRELQEKLYAQDRWSVLLIFQAMDAAGKDGTIEHVMSGVNPQGCDVHSFKAPSAEELDHDFLWRTTCRLPQRGKIGIFNRSYYEEVLVARVHPEILGRQKLPKGYVTKKIWKERYEDINALERYLARNGTLIRKFFLHVSKAEQKRRFLSRLEEPSKNWKFSLGDAQERGYWGDYMEAYEDAIRNTSKPWARWHVVPADNKWFTRLAVASAVVDALTSIDLHFPEVDDAQRAQLAKARTALMAEREKR
jgi:PPK2 family polyphosphate:nucleotide phosphotransferase